MAKDADKKGMMLIREVETRLVWIAGFLVNKRGNLASAAAKAADEGLDEYQRRFPALTPSDLPAE
jgi:hypothetical protein